MHPAFLYLPGGRLTLPELSAARIDGDVVALGEGFIPADLVEDQATRASTLSPIVFRGAAAAGPTAAWVHGAGDLPPTPHHIRRAVPRRLRPRPDQRVVFHDTLLPASAVIELGGVAVTTPARTMIDLALGVHRHPDWALWARRFAQVSPLLVAEATTALRSLVRVPGSRTGLALLEELAVRTT